MTLEKIEIHRSASSLVRNWPVWLNLLAVALATGLLVAISWWTINSAEKTLRTNVASKLETILKIETEAVHEWVRSRKQLANFLASGNELISGLATYQAADSKAKASKKTLLEQGLADISRRMKGATCVLMAPEGEVIAITGKEKLVEYISSLEDQFCQTYVSGKSNISPLLEAGADSNAPSVFVFSAPVTDPDTGVLGFLAIGVEAESELSKILASSRAGETGETLAFSAAGRLVSESRFDDNSDQHLPNWFSELIPKQSSTKIVNVDGSLDQRGVEVAFATRWLPRLQTGLVTKIDLAEANGPIVQIRRLMWTLFGLLLASAFATAFYRWYIYRLRLAAKTSDLERKKLGPYELERKVGEGGMGVVYLGKHSLLRRPTAVKILPPEKSNQTSIDRFEREVQFTSQLKHPNTISIYDYGRTANGLFYYAMELLDGLNLEQLVRREGPLSDGRVVSILTQVCESLEEAHARGLVHRDIKPANIMLCNRGGAVDTVKVLDFGMVREVADGSRDYNGALSGTPAYMAPECFTAPNEIDARVDIFAVGAVGFFLLTGKPLFSPSSLNELLSLHKTDVAAATLGEMNAVQGNSCDQKLVQFVACCIEPNPKRRLNSIEELLEILADCEAVRPWSKLDAKTWWQSSDGDEVCRDDKTRADVEMKNSVALDVTQDFKTARTQKDKP